MTIADLIRKYIPSVKTIGCFARITDITLKSDEELASLHRAGYDGLTIGIETGDDEALRFMNKGYCAADIVTQCRRLDQAGIHYCFFYLVSISGAGRGEIGAKATADVCNQLHPQIIGANMLTIYPDSELYQEIQRGNWKEEGEIEKYKEIRALIENLTIPTQFAALGASNAFQLQGTLPEDKDALIRGINHALAISIGLIEPAPPKLTFCLCGACADAFCGTGAFVLQKVTQEQAEKEVCTYCKQGAGERYAVRPKAGKGSV